MSRPATERDSHASASSGPPSVLVIRTPGVSTVHFAMSGYSGTPLLQKLGIKTSMRVVVLEGPANYRKLLGKVPKGIEFAKRTQKDAEFIHFFVRRRSELEKRLPELRAKLADEGTIWVSWPKKAARVPTDLTEDGIRAVALPLGLVDTKVCAIDDIWSGLKLMIRREHRRTKNSSK